MKSRSRSALATLALLVVALTACSDKGPEALDTGVVAKLSVTLAPSSVAVGETSQATVVATDSSGKTISSRGVVWSSGAGATVSSTGMVTAKSLGFTTIQANIGDVAAGQYLTITKVPKTLYVSGPYQFDSVVRNGVAFGVPLSVSVLDSAQQPVRRPGVVVTVTLNGTGTLSGVRTATTSESGSAAFTDLSITGPSGVKTLTFSAPGFPSAAFPITLVSGVPVKLNIISGNNQTTRTGDGLASIVAQVTDIDGYGVANVPVLFTVAAGGGNINGLSSTTVLSDANGMASIPLWRLGAFGLNTLVATASGIADNVTFTATAVHLVKSVQLTLPSPTGAVGQSLQLTYVANDENGSPFTPTSRVEWFISQNSVATITQTGVVTGVAAGTATVYIRVGGATAQQDVTVTGVATRKLLVNAPPSSLKNGTVFPVQPLVQLVSATTGLPIAEAGHAVIASVTGPAPGPASLTGATTVLTDAGGAARFTNLGVVGPVGGIEVAFRSDGAVPAAWTPVIGIAAGAPAVIAVETGDNQRGIAGNALAAVPTVSVRDISGNTVGAGVSVTFTVTAGGGRVTNVTALTDGGGIASAGSWILGAVGENTLTVSATGVPGSVILRATARPF